MHVLNSTSPTSKHQQSCVPSWETRSFKVSLVCEKLLQNEGNSASDICGHWGRKSKQAWWMQESISTLLHTLLYTYNSWILLCPSNCPSAPGCKGRALSAPAMTLSQIPHPSSAPESLITPRAEAQLPHLILRGCYLQEIRFLHWMAFLIQSRRVCCLLKCPPFPDKPVALPVSAALETPLLPISALAIAGVCQDALQSLCKPELCCPSQPCTLPLRPGNFGSFGNWTSSLSTNTPSTWEPWSRETPQSHPLHLQGEHSSQLES